MTVWEDTIVRLNRGELLHASLEAGRRWQDAEGGNAADRGGQQRSLDKVYAGAAGELAFAKWARRYWSGVQGRGASDVSGCEVRARRGEPTDETLELLIQPWDEERRPDAPFVLVVGKGSRWRVVGWTTPRRARGMLGAGAEIRDPGNVGRPVVSVAQRMLLPCDELQLPEASVA